MPEALQQTVPENSIAPFRGVIDAILQAKQTVNELLEGTVHSMTLLSINTSLNQLVNRVSHLSGLGLTSPPIVDFPPVTEFFGEPIHRPAAIKATDLDPDELSRLRFIAKVEQLYAQFDTLAPEGILNSHTTAEDQMVVRGVAKRAGVENYETATLNLLFMDKIAKAISEKRNGEKEEKRVENELKKQEALVSIAAKIKEIEAKRSQLLQGQKEAVDAITSALTDTQKKKAQAKADGIAAEITDADNLLKSLDQQLTTLQGPQ